MPFARPAAVLALLLLPAALPAGDKKAEDFAWGKPVDGLQLGVRLPGGRTYRVGDTLSAVVRVKNAGDTAVVFTYLARIDAEDLDLAAAPGEKPLEGVRLLGERPRQFRSPGHRALRPGETFDLLAVSFPIKVHPGGEARGPTFYDLPPGTYRASVPERMKLVARRNRDEWEAAQRRTAPESGTITFEVRPAAGEKE